MPKKQPFWSIVTPMPFYQSSESHITTVLMMPSVKPRPCIQNLIFHPTNIIIPEATSVHSEQSDDMNELFREEVPVSVAPEVPTVEGEEAHQAKDSVAPDA